MRGELKRFVNEPDPQHHVEASSEYVCYLLRCEQDRQGLRQLVMDGAASGRGRVVDASFFDALRAKIR